MVELEVVTPGEFLSDIIGDLGTRRSQIKNIEGQEDLQTVQAMIPLGETFSYTTALRSLSSGRANYSMEFKHYEPVSENVLKTLINI
jgi:elongation factor G